MSREDIIEAGAKAVQELEVGYDLEFGYFPEPTQYTEAALTAMLPAIRDDLLERVGALMPPLSGTNYPVVGAFADVLELIEGWTP